MIWLNKHDWEGDLTGRIAQSNRIGHHQPPTFIVFMRSPMIVNVEHVKKKHRSFASVDVVNIHVPFLFSSAVRIIALSTFS